MSRRKKISRTYRMAPLADAVITRFARALGESRSDFIERCVLDHALTAIETSKLIERLAAEDAVNPDLVLTLRRARGDALRRWAADLPNHLLP
jgi:uncharacterized protein (DUF1778 family)